MGEINNRKIFFIPYPFFCCCFSYLFIYSFRSRYCCCCCYSCCFRCCCCCCCCCFNCGWIGGLFRCFSCSNFPRPSLLQLLKFQASFGRNAGKIISASLRNTFATLDFPNPENKKTNRDNPPGDPPVDPSDLPHPPVRPPGGGDAGGVGRQQRVHRDCRGAGQQGGTPLADKGGAEGGQLLRVHHAGINSQPRHGRGERKRLDFVTYSGCLHINSCLP